MRIEIQIEKMTLKEKLRAMEALWESLPSRCSPVPQWHKDILDQRARLIKKGKARFIKWETAKRQIQKRIRENS